MILGPRLQKLALTAHVVSSVGWLGAVVAFLALGAVGLASDDAGPVRAVYVAMEVAVRFVIVPLSLASVATGLFQSLGTTWGLFRHYWVLIKFGLTVVAALVLLRYTPSIRYAADVAAQPPLTGPALGELDNPTHVVHAAGGLLVLLTTTTLSIFKPRGLTRYGRRKQRASGVER